MCLMFLAVSVSIGVSVIDVFLVCDRMFLAKSYIYIYIYFTRLVSFC